MAPEAVLLPGSQPGRQVRREELAVVFREGFELEGFTFDLKPQPLFRFFVGFFRLLMFISNEP